MPSWKPCLTVPAMGDRFEGYESLGMIFQTREEAEKGVA